jgi:multidrug resistance efflux pump
MKNAREVRLKLVFGALCLGIGLVLLNTQGGLAGSSIPAYVESIDHAVAPVVTGRISEVKVKLGERVKAGQVLLTLEDRAVRLEHERVMSELAQLEADLSAQQSIQKGQLVEGVLRSSSALADESAARSEADSLKVELERVEKLRAEKLVDVATETAVRREYLAAAARVKVFERRRSQLPELYAAGGNTMQAQTDARVQPYREALKAKRASLAELDWQLAQYEVRSPVDGVVGMLVHPIGDVVAAGTEVVRVVRGREGHLVATVPEDRARDLTPGLALTVRASKGILSKRLVGHVVEVGPSVEQLPVRSWLSPQWPRWGRRAVIQVEGEVHWQAGERLYVQF